MTRPALAVADSGYVRLPPKLTAVSAAIEPELVLGVDIGSRGGIALLTAAGELLSVHQMPVLADGPAGRPNVNAILLANIVRNSLAARAFVEHVGARPGEGAVGAFAFGRSAGVVAGVLGAHAIPVSYMIALAGIDPRPDRGRSPPRRARGR
jgi:hypothetical protein